MGTEVQTRGVGYLDLIQGFPLRPLRSEADLDRAVLMLDQLIDIGLDQRSTDQSDYMLVLGTLIKEYEDVHYPMPCELEEREVLRLHHEAWLARNPETSQNPS